MRALVTGAAGHLGTSLTELLVARGHQVRAALRGSDDPKKTGPLRKLGVEVVEADVLDAAAVERAAQGMDALFHLAAVFRFVTDDPDAIIEPAVRGAEHALRAAKKAGIGRVVLTSSAVAVGTRRLQDRPLDERDWNDAATNAYGRAQTLAELRADAQLTERSAGRSRRWTSCASTRPACSVQASPATRPSRCRSRRWSLARPR